MYERFTPRARWVMEQAGHVAKRMEHDYIGTEHVLLALLQERHGHAQRVFKQLLTDLKKVGKETEKLAERGSHNMAIGKLRQTSHVKNVVKCAQDEAHARQLPLVGTAMVLLGLLQEEDGIAAMVLTQNKVTHRGVGSILQTMSRSHVDLAKEDNVAAGSLLKQPWAIGAIAVVAALVLIAGVGKALGWW
ncbi:MAG: Clp protease N-terminal domain-containing protein [Planctomycetia bacterium]|nr:Clp protease N-terminal domain-containing protein [Planctomycetia bacterium]